MISDRDVNQVVDIDSLPKTWRVYMRKKGGKDKRNDDVPAKGTWVCLFKGSKVRRNNHLSFQLFDVKTTLEALAQQMQQQSLVLSELSKQIGQKGANQESNLCMGEYSQGESRLSGKKVQLPLFEGDDSVAWITRAEIYFDVQNTTDDMKVKPWCNW